MLCAIEVTDHCVCALCSVVLRLSSLSCVAFRTQQKEQQLFLPETVSIIIACYSGAAHWSRIQWRGVVVGGQGGGGGVGGDSLRPCSPCSAAGGQGRKVPEVPPGPRGWKYELANHLVTSV